MDPGDYAVYCDAVEKLHDKNPECIQLFESLENDRARSQLAAIYAFGWCNTKIDYDVALEYTRNNPEPTAIAVEAFIKIIVNRDKIYAPNYLSQLTKINEDGKSIGIVNRVLSEFFLNGICIPINYRHAVELYPPLSKEGGLKWELQFMNDSTKEELRKHLINIGEKKMASVIDNSQNPKKVCLEPSYKEKIDALLKTDKKSKEIELLCTEWYEKNPNAESAYYYLMNTRRPDENKADTALELLKKKTYVPKYLSYLINDSIKKENWQDVEFYLQLDASKQKSFDYYRAQLLAHNGDVDGACRLFLSTVYLNPKTNKYTPNSIAAIAHAFELKPSLGLYHRDYIDQLILTKNPHNVYIAASILYDFGDPRDKTRATNILSELSKSYYDAAKKMYEITSDEVYKKRIEELSFHYEKKSDYFYSSSDDTETILKNYVNLPPKIMLSALNELVNRYINGAKQTEIDYDKATELLNIYIDICEKYGLSTKYPKGKLGKLMYEHKIPCLNDSI